MLDERGKLHERSGLSCMRFYPVKSTIPLQYRPSSSDETASRTCHRDTTLEIYAAGISSDATSCTPFGFALFGHPIPTTKESPVGTILRSSFRYNSFFSGSVCRCSLLFLQWRGDSAVQEEMGGHGFSAESCQFLYCHDRLVYPIDRRSDGGRGEGVTISRRLSRTSWTTNPQKIHKPCN